MDRVDKLVKDFELISSQFPDSCLVKKYQGDELVPDHIVFTYYIYSSVSLVHIKAMLNDDNKTYRLTSGNHLILESVKPESIRSRLERVKIQVGLTGAINSDYKITYIER